MPRAGILAAVAMVVYASQHTQASAASTLLHTPPIICPPGVALERFDAPLENTYGRWVDVLALRSLKEFPAYTAEDCAHVCESSAECTRFAYLARPPIAGTSLVQKTQHVCLTYSGVSNVSPSTAAAHVLFDLYVRQIPGSFDSMTRRGKVLGTFQAAPSSAVATRDLCEAACRANVNCVAYSYSAPSWLCVQSNSTSDAAIASSSAFQKKFTTYTWVQSAPCSIASTGVPEATPECSSAPTLLYFAFPVSDRKGRYMKGAGVAAPEKKVASETECALHCLSNIDCGAFATAKTSARDQYKCNQYRPAALTADLTDLPKHPSWSLYAKLANGSCRKPVHSTAHCRCPCDDTTPPLHRYHDPIDGIVQQSTIQGAGDTLDDLESCVQGCTMLPDCMAAQWLPAKMVTQAPRGDGAPLPQRLQCTLKRRSSRTGNFQYVPDKSSTMD